VLTKLVEQNASMALQDLINPGCCNAAPTHATAPSLLQPSKSCTPPGPSLTGLIQNVWPRTGCCVAQQLPQGGLPRGPRGSPSLRSGVATRTAWQPSLRSGVAARTAYRAELLCIAATAAKHCILY